MRVPRVFGKFLFQLTLCSIVMEYADHGDLFQKIQRH